MIIPDRLYRTGNFDFMNRFVKEGEILFRPLSYYRAIEDKSRADQFEGIHVIDANKAKLEIIDPISGEIEATFELFGNLEYGNPQVQNVHVVCFSEEPQKQIDHTTVEIFDVKAMLDKISVGLSQIGMQLSCGSVRYYTAELLSNLPDVGLSWLYKRECFSDQKEFRLGFHCEDTKLMPIAAMAFGSFEEFARIL